MLAGRPPAALVLLWCTVALGVAGCATVLGREYEYEEQVFLATDGSASIVVNTSIAALVALRGLDLDPAASSVDRDRIRQLYTSSATRVTRVSRPWRRHDRTYVQVRVETDDVRSLGGVAPFAWSEYTFREQAPAPHDAAASAGGASGAPTLVYQQVVRSAAAPAARSIAWSGNELVAIRLHLPSRITYHNAPSKRVDRGNIVAWEQPLADRLRGEPIDIDVRMEGQSILYRTLTIFGLAMTTALAVLAAAIWWVVRAGRRSVEKEAPAR